MKRDDFVFTIGYQGDTAIVDGPSRRKHAGQSSGALLQAGLFRPALCASIYEGTAADFVTEFRRVSGLDVADEAALKRLFGVYEVPGSVKKVSVIG